MPYRFPEELQREINAFDGDDVGQVAMEIKIVRFLIQQAVKEGKHPLANALLSTLAKLSSVQITNEVRAGKLIELSTLVHIAQQMSSAVARRLAGLPNQDVLTDDLMADFSQIIRQGQQLFDLRSAGFRRQSVISVTEYYPDGTFDLLDQGTGEAHHGTLDQLPGLLARLGIDPRPLTAEEQDRIKTLEARRCYPVVPRPRHRVSFARVGADLQRYIPVGPLSEEVWGLYRSLMRQVYGGIVQDWWDEIGHTLPRTFSLEALMHEFRKSRPDSRAPRSIFQRLRDREFDPDRHARSCSIR